MRNRCLVVIVALCGITPFALGQQEPLLKDPRIENMMREVSAPRIRATIEKLVSFGTRHTLSDTSDMAHGIGAARRWIKSEFERAASASGGRMTVESDEFIIPQSQRVPRPTPSVNMVATLHPGDANQPAAKRTIVISGHYDS